MTVVYRNDGYSAQQGDGVVREAIPVFDASRQGVLPYSAVLDGPVVSLAAGSGNAKDASAAATLTGTATTTVYISGFEVTGSGATTGLPVTVTVAGLLGGTRSYTYVFAAGALLPNQPLIVSFNPPLPASAVNTAIVVTCPASGTGGTNNTVVSHGFYA